MMQQLEEGMSLQDRYRIARLLGGGGMGQVYLAHDTRLADKPCAVKELIPDPRVSPEEKDQAAAQFRREAAVLAHLNHPNLPNVSDYFEEGGRFYLVMDYIEGQTLDDLLVQSPEGLPVEDVVTWAIQLCDVLAYLHGQDPPVIFRDMKPANVMLTQAGDVKLIDFGVVRLFDPSKGTDTLKMGTAGYAPPEQYAGQGQTTPRSDVYALGATLHELMTGEDPTERPFVFTSPSQLKPDLSPALAGVVMRALSLDPEGRFPSAEAMRDALREATREAAVPRRLRLPFLQRKRGTGTAVMPEATAAPAVPVARSRPARIALGVGRWLLRLVFIALLAVLVTALVLLLVGSFVLSAVAESAVASTDWHWEHARPGEQVVSESDVNESVRGILVPYALDVAESAEVDFHSPDMVVLSMEISSTPVTLEARVEIQDGRPAVILERLNGVPLYIVGGIISGGINRGIERSWEKAPVALTSLAFEERQVVFELKRE